MRCRTFYRRPEGRLTRFAGAFPAPASLPYSYIEPAATTWRRIIANLRNRMGRMASLPYSVQQPAGPCLWGVSDAMRSSCILRLLFLIAISGYSAPSIASSQTFTSSARSTESPLAVVSVCGDTAINAAASKALRLVCQNPPITHTATSATIPLIVIGFVGGFVKPDDLRHPEPLFALYLGQEYGSEVHARAFSNHDAKDAQSYVLQLLDTNHDGIVSSEEKKRARIVIYGHSWGASETAAFARRLGRIGIPVLLTIQLDIISKPRQNPGVIPPNVARAINFYQSNGPLHGRPTIVASDPARTSILGNIRMLYGHSQVNCTNYGWFARTFNRPHHEIENDERVWNQVASLVVAEMQNSPPTGLARKSQDTRQAVSQADARMP